MKQLRTYILLTGRGADGEPVRRLFKYGGPVAGATDDYEHMTVTQLKAVESALRAEAARVRAAFADIEAEKIRRLEAT